MNKIKYVALSIGALAIIVLTSAYTKSTPTLQKTKDSSVTESNPEEKNGELQTVNLFVTHGHCSTPFSGKVNDLKINLQVRTDGGNPIEGMEISFNIDPNTFNVCSGEEATKRIKKPGLFVSKDDDQMKFRSTNIYTMGIDWYQVNGKLSIKGVEKSVKFFMSGIRDPKESMASMLIVEGQMNLLNWGIDYDKIVNGNSDPVPTKWMHLNMKIKMDGVLNM